MQIIIGGVPLLAGQAKAVAIAAAELERGLSSAEPTGDSYKDKQSEALLKLIREVREIIDLNNRQ